MSTEFHERLAWSRRQAGFTGSREAARTFGWNENTYKSHETGVRAGTRPPEHDVVRKYARAFAVDFIWLLVGEGSPKRRNVIRISGTIGSGGEIVPDTGESNEERQSEMEVPFTLPEGAIAFEVEGDALAPRYDAGDVVICWRGGPDVDSMVGWEAVAQTSDGRRFLKRIRPGSRRGFYDLEDHASPPMKDAKVESAAGIAAVVRAGQWKRVEPSVRPAKPNGRRAAR